VVLNYLASSRGAIFAVRVIFGALCKTETSLRASYGRTALQAAAGAGQRKSIIKYLNSCLSPFRLSDIAGWVLFIPRSYDVPELTLRLVKHVILICDYRCMASFPSSTRKLLKGSMSRGQHKANNSTSSIINLIDKRTKPMMPSSRINNTFIILKHM
jgi:hypothetical protein